MRKGSKRKAIITGLTAIILMIVFSVDSAGTVPGMDTKLSDSNASFLGEGPGDGQGSQIATAGDVNGDGYDDILISARENDEGGSNAGQTYLIFGNASGWSMDIDLSEANASFIGEASEDWSGVSVASAGDVNGDGFDDILIGASLNDAEGDRAGKTYLIFGRPSGWESDMNLSEANASFLGENEGDNSGSEVAGAGDVNGDGFDDILIGAMHNDDSGLSAGQTYLIFGKGSGWTMNTSLSKANASFLGEGENDKSGESVAGAGDVNGDGFDDILIGVRNNDEGGDTAGQTYLISGKRSGWSMDTNLSHVDASFVGSANDESGTCVEGAGDVNGDGFDDILINAPKGDCNGYDNGLTYLIFGRKSGWSMDTDLSEANASFYGHSAEWSGQSVAGTGDVNGDGYDDILIGSWINTEGGLYAGQTYLVLGNASGLSMETRLNDVDASFLGEVIRDYSGREVAGAGDVNGDGYDDILISAPGSDEGGSDAGQTYLIFYDDGAPPIFGTDMTPTDAFTGDTFTFSIGVRDYSGLSDVKVEYWSGETGVHTNLSMIQASGDLWSRSITAPWDSLDTLHYFFYANDTSTNIAITTTRNVRVHDNDAPRIITDDTWSSTTTGDELTFSVFAKDNINLSIVMVEYWYGLAAVHTNTSMTYVSGDLWSHTITVPLDSLETLHYFYYLEDNSSNYAKSTVNDVSVIDDDPPYFGKDTTPGEGTTGDPFTFCIEVGDNIGVERVWVEYWYAVGTPTTLSLSHSEDLMWEGSIVIDDTIDDLFYIAGTVDTSDVMNTSIERMVDIVDNDKPEILEDTTSRTTSTGNPFKFSVTVSDNIGIYQVLVWYAYGEDEWSSAELEIDEVKENGTILYSIWIVTPTDTTEPLQYHLEVEDLNGNVLVGTDSEVIVVDDDRPRIDYEDAITTSLKGLPIVLNIEARDNIGVEEAFLIMRYGGHEPSNLTMEFSNVFSIEVAVPRHPDGDLIIQFSARDAAGNWNSTAEFTIELLNAAPSVEELLSWTITEDAEASFDLEPYLTDENDGITGLTVVCSDNAIAVEDLVLKASYSVPGPDWTVVLTVSDGEDDTHAELTVHIDAVNDVPEIVSVSPLNGSKFKEGKVVTFSVETFDEDGDELVVTWKEKDTALGTGKTLDYRKLKPGDRVITVYVSDGEETVEQTFTVIIKKDEGSPAYDIIGALMAILVVALVVRNRRRCSWERGVG